MSPESWMMLAVVETLLAIGVGFYASDKGRSGFLWFVYAMLLLPIAALHVLFASPSRDVVVDRALRAGQMRRCPACQEPVSSLATRCPHCTSAIAPA